MQRWKTWKAACLGAAAGGGLLGLAGCEYLANLTDRGLNELAEPQPVITDADRGYHSQFLVVDLHADTLMWRRGLNESSALGQVDLKRLREGNVGLQVLTMPTRTPGKDDARQCTDAANSDPVPILAMANGWPPAAWVTPYHRAIAQAEELKRVAGLPRRDGAPYVTQIRELRDLESWLAARFPASGEQNDNAIGVLLGAEGAHAFSPDLGEEFETLVDRYGLRLVGPMHHFTNAYGGSSEGCEKPLSGLTATGKRLVRTLFSRGMIVDMAHASSAALDDAAVLANELKRPILASHTGVRSYLEQNPQAGVSDAHRRQAEHRAMSGKDIAQVAGTGGTVGIIYWEDQIGAAKVENVVGSITRAYCDLKKSGGTGFHTVTNASEHVSLGSDWDGAAKNTVDAAHVAAITVGLKEAGFSQDDIANIAGRNACRVIAQSLSHGSFDYAAAKALCRRPSSPVQWRPPRSEQTKEICSGR
jgi:microsomal dipeptidase-like Zn-dependent dipeptidase